jgi:hypothetical protein
MGSATPAAAEISSNILSPEILPGLLSHNLLGPFKTDRYSSGNPSLLISPQTEPLAKLVMFKPYLGATSVNFPLLFKKSWQG